MLWEKCKSLFNNKGKLQISTKLIKKTRLIRDTLEALPVPKNWPYSQMVHVVTSTFLRNINTYYDFKIQSNHLISLGIPDIVLIKVTICHKLFFCMNFTDKGAGLRLTNSGNIRSTATLALVDSPLQVAQNDIIKINLDSTGDPSQTEHIDQYWWDGNWSDRIMPFCFFSCQVPNMV